MNYSHYAVFVLALAVVSWLVHAWLIRRRHRNQLRRAWRIAQDVAVERGAANDEIGADAADEICERIEAELGL
jgi:hypothetical protein